MGFIISAPAHGVSAKIKKRIQYLKANYCQHILLFKIYPEPGCFDGRKKRLFLLSGKAYF
jgi:hypothetical protein